MDSRRYRGARRPSLSLTPMGSRGTATEGRLVRQLHAAAERGRPVGAGFGKIRLRETRARGAPRPIL